MSANNGGPAFPRDHAHDGHNGMTLRDYFAAEAMAALIHSYDTSSRLLARTRGSGKSTSGEGVHVISRDAIAAEAYAQADAMLRARGEP